MDYLEEACNEPITDMPLKKETWKDMLHTSYKCLRRTCSSHAKGEGFNILVAASEAFQLIVLNVSNAQCRRYLGIIQSSAFST